MEGPGKERSVAVIGGGISGLAAAHRLQEVAAARSLPLRVDLLEASSRLGGVISTVERDGFLLEEGPDSILTDKSWGRDLAERSGLGHEIIATRDSHRRSFVLRRGALVPTPVGVQILAPARWLPMLRTPLFSLRGKARMALDLVIPPRRSEGDESVGGFVRRRLGREALDRLAGPMIAGIYGADPEKLSLLATLPRFARMEKEHGSVIRGLRAEARRAARREGEASGARYGLFVSFRRGLESLPLALASRLPRGSVRLGTAAISLARRGGIWEVVTGAGVGRYDAVVLAVPPHQAASLLRPVDAALSGRLAGILSGDAATVSLAFRRDQIGHPLDGFGFVAPASETLGITGCTFTHVKYEGRAPAGTALLRAFWGSSSAGLNEAAIVDRTLRDLRGPLSLQGQPILSHVARWPRAMPCYEVGHLDRVAAIERLAAAQPLLALAGNAYRGIGIPDCVRSGEAAAESLLDRLA